MDVTANGKMEKKSESPEAIADGSKKLQSKKDGSAKNESKNSSYVMSATTPKDSQRTWTNAELEKLQSKIGLLGAVLSDLIDAGMLVAAKIVPFESAGTQLEALKIVLVAQGLNLVAVETPDGIDFQFSKPSVNDAVTENNGISKA